MQNNTTHINTNWTSLFIFVFDIFTRTYYKKFAFRKIKPQVKVFETFGRHDNAKIPLSGNKSALSKYKIGHEIFGNLIHVMFVLRV